MCGARYAERRAIVVKELTWGVPLVRVARRGEWGWCACREVILICKTMCDCVSTSLSYHTHVLFGGGGALYVRAIPAQFSGLF